MKRVIVELRVPAGADMSAIMEALAAQVQGFEIDRTYTPVPASAPPVSAGPGEQVLLIRGVVEESAEPALRSAAGVVGVWSDARIEPF